MRVSSVNGYVTGKVNSSSNKPAFEGVRFVDIPLLPSEVKAIAKNPDGYKSIINNKPLQIIKDIIENTPIFKDLSRQTDLFVHTSVSKEKNSRMFGVLKAHFVNPLYGKIPNQKPVEMISFQDVGFQELTIYEKFQKIAEQLPCFHELKNGTLNSNQGKQIDILKAGDEWFITSV